MLSSRKLKKDYYTETEAAQVLGVSLAQLQDLLDQYIFNDGLSRPPNLQLLSTDLVLLRYWISDVLTPRWYECPVEADPCGTRLFSLPVILAAVS